MTRGKFATIDVADLPLVRSRTWYANLNKKECSAASMTRRGEGAQRLLYMHRVIVNAPGDMHVDHRDHDRLNNRRSNLRVCTPAENSRNMRRRGSRTPFKGVYPSKQPGRFYAVIHPNQKFEYLGTFSDAADAALAYDAAAKKHFGEFACLNFPERSVAV